jgi:hypothetical protein
MKPYDFDEAATPVKTCLIFAGGCGLNVATHVMDLPNVHCIDTCDKNIVDAHRTGKVFLTQGTRGAGKNRAFILPKVRPQIPTYMATLPEADFYIVCYSLGGGSGSVLGPLITGALADRQAAFVSFVIGAMESPEVLQNDIDTMKSLESIAVRKETPIVINYTPNVNGQTYEYTNSQVAANIRRMVCLTNQNHQRLDVFDVQNWVRFTDKHKNLIPQVCELHISDSRKDAELVPEPIAVASLYLDPAKEFAFGSAIVRTTGIMRSDDLDVTEEQLHFVINSVGVVEVMKSISDTKTEVTRQLAKFVQRNPLLDPDDNADEDGMVV